MRTEPRAGPQESWTIASKRRWGGGEPPFGGLKPLYLPRDFPLLLKTLAGCAPHDVTSAAGSHSIKSKVGMGIGVSACSPPPNGGPARPACPFQHPVRPPGLVPYSPSPLSKVLPPEKFRKYRKQTRHLPQIHRGVQAQGTNGHSSRYSCPKANGRAWPPCHPAWCPKQLTWEQQARFHPLTKMPNKEQPPIFTATPH